MGAPWTIRAAVAVAFAFQAQGCGGGGGGGGGSEQMRITSSELVSDFSGFGSCPTGDCCLVQGTVALGGCDVDIEFEATLTDGTQANTPRELVLIRGECVVFQPLDHQSAGACSFSVPICKDISLGSFCEQTSAVPCSQVSSFRPMTHHDCPGPDIPPPAIG